MFFASKHKVGFEGMRDVIKAYPEWELKVISGSEAKIANRAMAGDASLEEFVKRDHENPKNTRFQNFDEAMNALVREQVSICEVRASTWDLPGPSERFQIWLLSPFHRSGVSNLDPNFHPRICCQPAEADQQSCQMNPRVHYHIILLFYFD